MLKYSDDLIKKGIDDNFLGNNLLDDNLLVDNLLGDNSPIYINNNIKMDTKAMSDPYKNIIGNNFL